MRYPFLHIIYILQYSLEFAYTNLILINEINLCTLQLLCWKFRISSRNLSRDTFGRGKNSSRNTPQQQPCYHASNYATNLLKIETHVPLLLQVRQCTPIDKRKVYKNSLYVSAQYVSKQAFLSVTCQKMTIHKGKHS